MKRLRILIALLEELLKKNEVFSRGIEIRELPVHVMTKSDFFSEEELEILNHQEKERLVIRTIRYGLKMVI